MTATNPRRARLARRLRALRETRFDSQTALADHLGWLQPRVSKIETAAQLPSEDDIRAWVVAVGADNEVEAELLALRTAARLKYVTVEDVVRGVGFAEYQARRADLEVQYTRIGEFQPAMVPGLLQTASYARRLLTLSGNQPDVDAAVAARMLRQQRVLSEPGKRIQMVLGEAALWTHFGEPDILTGQLHWLATVTTWDAMELGIVPFDAAWPVFPVCSFAIYDEDLAIVETYASNSDIDEPDQVRHYVRAFEKLRSVALTGEAARLVIQRAADRGQRDGGGV